LVQDGRKPLTRPALNGLQNMQIVRGAGLEDSLGAGFVNASGPARLTMLTPRAMGRHAAGWGGPRVHPKP